MTSVAIAPGTMGALTRSVYQAIGDLGYLLDKDDYLELFRRFSHIGRTGDVRHAIAERDPVRRGCASRKLADRVEAIRCAVDRS